MRAGKAAPLVPQRPPAQAAPYRVVKDYVLQQIRSGAWARGDMIPSENKLAEQFGLSRMTVNRALRELTGEQVLLRVQGTGTFVAPEKYQSTIVEIRSLAHEIAERGHVHRATVLVHQLERDPAVAARFAPAGAALFHSVVLHYENEVAIQLEDRYVNPELFPDYLAQDFRQLTPNEYLTNVAPIERAEFDIEALMPDPLTAERLAMAADEPCLVLNRRTWSYGQVASVAALRHPGARYRFSGRF